MNNYKNYLGIYRIDGHAAFAALVEDENIIQKSISTLR